MKHICFVSPSVYGYFNKNAPPGGGAQRQLSLLSRTLSSEFDVSFVVGDYGQPRYETRDGVKFHRAYRPDPRAQSYKQLVKLWKLRKAMTRADADAYVYRGHPQKAAFVYLLAKSLETPFVYNLANDPNIDEQPAALSKPVRWLFERAITDAAIIIAQTAYQAHRLDQEYDIRATIVPNGYPPAEDFTSYDKRRYFLWVGRLDEDQKCPHYYLDLAERVRSERFLLIGPNGQDVEYNNQIRRRANELDNVVDKGSIEPDDIHDFYRDAIALINTSAYEGFPNTFLEAWRYHTPVLSLSVDPNRFINPEIGGHANDNFETLVNLSKSVADDFEARQLLGKPAGEFVQSRLTIEAVAERYATALRTALNTS